MIHKFQAIGQLRKKKLNIIIIIIIIEFSDDGIIKFILGLCGKASDDITHHCDIDIYGAMTVYAS